MKKSCIVTGGTKNQFPAMAVLALNIANICPTIADELIIYHDGICKSDQKKINKIFPTIFIKYKSPFHNQKNFSDVITSYFSPMVFCKYECLRLLTEYHTVIWTDYDILINKDFTAELKALPKSSFILTKPIIDGMKDYPDSTMYCNIDLLKPQFSAALMLFRDNLPNPNEIYKNCINETKKLAKYLYLPEQVVLTIVFLKHNISFNEINNSNNRYTLHPNEANRLPKDKTLIYHAYGQPKFWNGLDNSEWNKLYNEWIFNYKGSKFEKEYFSFRKLFSRIKNKVEHILSKKNTYKK